MFFSNMVMFFIIVTTAATPACPRQSQYSERQRRGRSPCARWYGNGAYLLFTLGIIGTGMLGIPVLAGSSAYAVAESQAWGSSLNRPLKLAPRFMEYLPSP